MSSNIIKKSVCASIYRAPVAVDLFAGAGGFSLGALKAGIDVVAAVENNAAAALTYRRNLVDSKLTRAKLFMRDMLELDPHQFLDEAGLVANQCDILLGGPPCQGFSAHRFKDAGVGDPRNRLLLRYFEFVRALRPAFFIVENVPGLLWARHSGFVKTFYATAEAAGYDVFAPVLINARDHGVPQNRRRVFILGYDASRSPSPAWPPEASHVDPDGPADDPRPRWLTAADIFKRSPLKGDVNDVHMNHNDALREAFRNTPPNGGSRSESGRMLRCHLSHSGHSDVYGRIDPSRPGPTMTTACINPSKGRFVHPVEDHGITLRQAAWMQTFPDWFVFEGGLMAGGVQVGNAVPVTLAAALLAPIGAAVAAMRNAPAKAKANAKRW